MSGTISAVLIHVGDVETAIEWYLKAFPQAVLKHLEAFDFSYLQIGDVDLEIVPADEKFHRVLREVLSIGTSRISMKCLRI